MRDLSPLLDRLRRAEGPDRRLDDAIWDTFGLVDEKHCKNWCSASGRTDLTREMYISAWSPKYTASVDSALELVARLLPGWWRAVEEYTSGDGGPDKPYWYARIGTVRVRAVDAEGPTPALAILIACFEALSADAGRAALASSGGT